jgi:hypothetical protein
MVLISIHPFALRKLFLFVVALVCFSAFCFADPVLMVRRSSPAKATGLPRLNHGVELAPTGFEGPAASTEVPSFSSSAASLRRYEWRVTGARISSTGFADFEMDGI